MKSPVLFGKYLLLERINVGGMAEVFIAKAFGIEGFERVLAVKKILPTMAADQEFITMFIDEARISVQLNHANIVHIHELGKHDESFYIAMEYVSGPDLRTILDRFRAGNARMPIAQAAYIAAKICEGLDYAHRKKDGRGMDLNIIHRDVSPQNVLISYEGEVKIIDFGIAKAANRSHQTQAGILKGKFAYMSPEQVRGQSIDRRSDIFAVGNILFEMLTGERLFVGGSDFSVVEKVRNAEVPSVREIDPEIPAGLEQILYRALARDLNERYQWASEMQEDLLRFQLVGDTIYSSKNLSVFMKEAFAEDLSREHGRMERFTAMQRPPELEPSGVSQTPFVAPPRPPALGPSPALRPPARRPPTPHRVNVAQAAAGVEEPSISVDPSIPSFQYPPTDQTAVNDQGRSDTFISNTPEPRERRRVERGERVVIGDDEELIDAATAPRPAYAPGSAAPAPANRASADEEPPPWPSLEGRGQTVISQAPPPPRAPAGRKEGPGRHVTPKPGPGPGPRSALGADQPAPPTSTDVSGASLPALGSEDVEDLAVRATVADMPVPAGLVRPGARMGAPEDGALPSPPPPEIPSVTNVEVPQLPPEPATLGGERTAEHSSLDARTTTDSVAVPLPGPSSPGAIPLPAPSPAAPAPTLLDAAAEADASDSVIGKALDVMLPDAQPHGDAAPASGSPAAAVDQETGEDSVTPHERPGDEPPVAATPGAGAETGPMDEEELGSYDKTEAREIPALEEIRRRAAAEEGAETEEEGSHDKTEMRAPEGWAPPPEDAPPEEPAPSRAALGTVQRGHTPTEGWDEARAGTRTHAGEESGYGAAGIRTDSEPAYGGGVHPEAETDYGAGASARTSAEPAYGSGARTGAEPAYSSGASARTSAEPAYGAGARADSGATYGSAGARTGAEPAHGSGARADPEATRGGPGPRADAGPTYGGPATGGAEDEEELPPWPSLEGRGETVIGVLPSPPPKKRPGSLRAGQRGTPAAGTPKAKTGNYVVGRMDDSSLDEPATSAERPRLFPPGGRPQGGTGTESVLTDLPAERSAERSDVSLPSYRPSGVRRGSRAPAPPPFDRRKLAILGGAGAGLLALIIGLVVAFTGDSTEPVWINISARKGVPVVVQIDSKVVPNTEVANLEPGDHELTATAPGFRPLKRRLTVSKRTPPVTDQLQAVDPGSAPAPARAPAPGGPPSPAPSPPAPAPAPAPAAPQTFVAVFSTEELDVEISVGGKSLGKTPGVQAAGLKVGRDYYYAARKPGFKMATGKFRSEGQAEVTVPVDLEKLEPAVAAPPPRKVERGELACATRPNGAQIFVNGRATGRTTPAPPSNPIRLPAGKHKITFKLGDKSVDRMVVIKAGRLETLTNVEL